MVDKHSLLDVNKIDEFHNGIRNNQIICPKFQYCGSSGTFVRREIFNLLKFGGKGGGKVLNQRAEQSKRAEYKNYLKFYKSFDEVKLIEFEKRYPLNKDELIPPAFTNFTLQDSMRISFGSISMYCYS